VSALLLAKAFWLAAPVILAGVLHMIVVRRDLLAALKRPLDGGRTFRGEPIFGPNKTWRGVVFMTFAPALLGALQGLAWGEWARREGVEPCALPEPLVFGYADFNLVLGFGYALGELPNSFVKRRVGIEAGKTSSKIFFVIDQADSVVAALGLGALFFRLEWRLVLTGIVALTGVHLALNAGLYFAKVRRNL
jgi:CDP-diglyceride synthetase